MKTYDVLRYPINTEKAVKMIDRENKLLFSVDKRANKSQIKEAVEKAFNVKVLKVNTLFSPHGEKRAYVTLAPSFQAADVMTKLGLM